MTPHKIITNHVHPPIPIRSYDWTATLDGYDGAPDAKRSEFTLVGNGATEQEAIDNLTDQLAEFQAEVDFDKGRDAFLADDDHLLYQCTDEFRDGYREAFLEWATGEYPRAAEGDYLDDYWDAHHDEAVRNMRERLLAKVLDTPKTKIAKANVKAQVRSFALGALTAIVLGMFMLAPVLLDASDVVAFWKEVGR